MPPQYGLDVSQLTIYVIRPALVRIGRWSLAAEALVLGTALQESAARYLDQLAPGPGPAYGLWQMEEATYADLWRNFIPSSHVLRAELLNMAGYDTAPFPPVRELWGNLNFGAAMCRVHYARIKEALPRFDPDGEVDAVPFCRYWKRYYNTELGRGTVEQALPHFRFAIQTVLQTQGVSP